MQHDLAQYQYYLRLYNKLESERSNWESHWKDLSEYIIPQ